MRAITDRWVNAFNVGGPVVKNRLFFYGSGRVFQSKSTRAANLFGPLPDREENTTEFFGKITASLASNMALNVGYRHRPTEIDYAGIGTNDSPAVATNTEGTNRVVNVNYDWFAGSRTTVSAKYVRMDEQSEAVAVTDLGFQPPFDPNNLAEMGRVVVNGVAVGGASLRLDRRKLLPRRVQGDLTHFLDLAGMQHKANGGIRREPGRGRPDAPEQRMGQHQQRHGQRPDADPRQLLSRTADAAVEGPLVLAVLPGRHHA